MQKKMSKNLSKINFSIVVFSVFMCIMYATLYFLKQDYLMVFTSLIVMLLPLLIYVVDKITKTIVPDPIKTAYLVFVFASAILGAIGNFYEYIHFYDKIVHFASGLLISSAFAVWYEKLYKKYNIWEIIFSLTCFNATIAMLWEVFEYTMDLLFDRHVQKGLSDTMTDMIMAVIGGILIAIVYIDRYNKKIKR